MKIAVMLWPALMIWALLTLELRGASRRAWWATLIVTFIGDILCVAWVL